MFDNLSELSEGCSDMLCRSVSGYGFSKRELYTNDDDVIYNIKRTIGINGINLTATKPDLLERSILIALERISTENRKQESEIDQSLAFLRLAEAPTENWVMCYPYGGYNSSLIGVLKRKGCSFAFTTTVDVTHLCRENAYTLERLDTNDLPKSSNATPNLWTKKIIQK